MSDERKKISELPELLASNSNMDIAVVDNTTGKITKRIKNSTLIANGGDALQTLSQVIALISDKVTVSSGSGAPVSTPVKIGDMYVDTVDNIIYWAFGTASSADWFSETETGTVAPVSTPDFIGQRYVDTVLDNIYIASGTASSADWEHLNAPSTYDYEFEGDTAGSTKVTLVQVSNATTDIKITKPVSVYFFHDFVTSTAHTTTISQLQNGGYRTIWTTSALSDQYSYSMNLNPGEYRVVDSHSGAGNLGTSQIVATGVANGELTTVSILEV